MSKLWRRKTMLRKGENMWVPCTRCGTMYQKVTKRPGLCQECQRPMKNNEWFKQLNKIQIENNKRRYKND